MKEGKKKPTLIVENNFFSELNQKFYLILKIKKLFFSLLNERYFRKKKWIFLFLFQIHTDFWISVYVGAKAIKH